MVQIPNFFRIFPTVKKLITKPQQAESISYNQNKKREFESKNENNFFIERKKRPDNLLVESLINEIKIKAEGKFFYNKPTLKKKTNLEIEYLVIKAPFKPENAAEIFLDQSHQKTDSKKIKISNDINLNFTMGKSRYRLEETNICSNSNILLPRKGRKNNIKNIEISSPDKLELIGIQRPDPKDYLAIEDMPDLFIEEWPGKRYVSVGMENMSFPGNLRPEFCLEIDPNEEIFVPNVYDMLLIQNFWDNLEMKSFRLCLRPKGFASNKNLIKEADIDNKENINDNKDINESAEKEGEKIEEKKEGEINIDNKEGNDILQRQESKGDEGNKEGKKKKFNLFKSIMGKKKGS